MLELKERMLSMFGTNRATKPSVMEGATYRRVYSGNIVETARVLSIARDPAGIPHVRYELNIDRACNRIAERRTLALESFWRLYREGEVV